MRKKVDGIIYEVVSPTEVALVDGEKAKRIKKEIKSEGELVGWDYSIVIPEYVTIKKKKYKVTSIGKSAFANTQYYTQMSIPNGVRHIGDWAFRNGEFKQIIIPISVESIGEEAFGECWYLISVVIPKTVTSIGKGVFYDCGSLENIIVDADNTVYDSRDNCNAIIETSSNTLIAGCKKSVIPNTVTNIGDRAFYSINLRSGIVLPNGITNIGERAFRYCDLDNIIIPNSLKSIGKNAFRGNNFKKVTIPNSVAYIGEYAFSYNSKLEHATVPDFIIKGGLGVFSECENLISIRGHNVGYPQWILDDIISNPHIQSSINYAYSYELRKWAQEKVLFNKERARKEEEQKILQYRNTFAGYVETATKNGKISKIPTVEEYVKPKVERDINEWQKKDEFESTEKWKARVNEATRNEKAKELAQKYKNEYVALQEKQKKEYEAVVQEFYAMKEEKQKVKFKADLLKLSTYDADNQSFMIKSGSEVFADILLPVKVEDAPSFKANWEKIKLTATLNYVPNGDDVALTAVTFKDGDKTYTYDSNTKAKYAVTEIDYNFKPIELAMTEGDNINYTFNPLEEMAQRVVTTPEQDLSKRQNGVTVERKKLSVGGQTGVDTGKQPSVVRLADVDTDIPSGAQAANNTFAVIIGNENYSQVSKVPYALNDAKIFATYCQKTLGLPQKNIKTYADATFGILLSAVDNIKKIAEAYKGNLNVIFYYAGHGLPNEDSKDAFLLPVDADGRNTAACYATNKLYEELAGLGAKSVTVFMDACFSGAQRGEGMLASARGVAIKPRDVEPKGNMVVFSAASADETAYPYTEKGHGLFTYFLLKKLQESKGNATLGELGSYIREKVSQESIVTNGKSQTPTIVSSAALGDGWKNMRLK
ncbi:MAG: leucine-rich repeat protein [Bacteroidaceae bacterium]|nr:leucine-rich repeat protein [Bacteroidaceae bacterium]